MVGLLSLVASLALGLTAPQAPRSLPPRECELVEDDQVVQFARTRHSLSITVCMIDRTPLDPATIVVMWACGEDPNVRRLIHQDAYYFSLPDQWPEAWQRLSELADTSERDEHRAIIAEFQEAIKPWRRGGLKIAK